MERMRIILALLVLCCGASYGWAQDSGAVGGICRVGERCPINPGPVGDGRIDPSPYDPQHPGQPHNPHQPPPPPPYNPGQPNYPQPGNGDRREVYIGQYFRDQDLSLMRLFNLSPWSNQGTQIQSVEVYLQDNGRSTLTLMADGYVVAAQNYLSPQTILYPNRPLVLGQDVRSALDLVIRGKLYIERIVLNSRNGNYQPNPPPYPPPGQNDVVLQGSVYQSFYAPGNIDIAQVTGLMNYQGYQIASITVNGRTLNFNSAQTRLLINGMIEGQVYLGGNEGSQQIFPQRAYIIGRNVNAVTLLIDGGISISTVQVRLRRF